MPLSEVRIRIDKVDKQMKELFIERMGLSEQVVLVKAETNDKIYKPEREVSMIAARSEDVDPLIQKQYQAFFGKIIEVSKEYQYRRMLQLTDCLDITWTDNFEPKKVASLKSELYVCDMFSKDEVVTVNSLEELMTLIETGVVDAGVGIIETIDSHVYGELCKMISKYNLYINRTVLIPDGEVIRKVAIFSKHLVVKPENNYLKIKITCDYESGSLSRVLSVIADKKMRISKIHSIPEDIAPNGYTFYIEIEINLLDEEAQAMVFQLESETRSFQIIGSY